MRTRTSFAVVAAIMATGPVLPTPVHADEAGPEAIVDGLNAVFGKHKARASHAKGICVKGTFTPTAESKGLSKAPHFAAAAPVIGRFSMGGGNPKVPDNAKPPPRGLALRFDLGSDKNTDLVAISAPIFFAKTPAQMLGFLQARVPGADGKPDQEKIKAFAAANPDTAKQGAWIGGRPMPASYATANYWAIHAFKLTNEKGDAATVKFKLVPGAGESGLSDDEAKAKPADFYTDDLKERFGKGPVAFDLLAIIGEASDPTDDLTVAWPEESRKNVKLGSLSISGVEPEATCNAITFDPTNLADGIAGSANDPILPLRSPAYAISLTRRTN